MHCWPNSTLSSDLSAAGHKVVAAGEGERNLTSRHRAAIHADIIGALEPMTEGSTKPVTSTVRHAGMTAVERYNAVPPPDPVQNTIP